MEIFSSTETIVESLWHMFYTYFFGLRFEITLYLHISKEMFVYSLMYCSFWDNVNKFRLRLVYMSSRKELSLCHKLWIYTPYIFGFICRKSLIFQTSIIWSNRIHSWKYLRSTTLESKDRIFFKILIFIICYKYI